jgi:hypothetical protein
MSVVEANCTADMAALNVSLIVSPPATSRTGPHEPNVGQLAHEDSTENGLEQLPTEATMMGGCGTAEIAAGWPRSLSES